MFSIEILEVYKKCNIREFPINCEEILETYDYRIRTYDEILQQLPEAAHLAKAFSNDSFADTKNRLVLYNGNVNKYRARFSQMHELGHIILGHVGHSQKNEDDANTFASNILAPRVAISHFGCTTADEIHAKFGISYAAANIALSDYKKWKQGNKSKEDSDLTSWLFYPNFYRLKENHLKNKERDRRKRKKKIDFLEERRCWIEDNISDYDEMVWQAHERSFF